VIFSMAVAASPLSQKRTTPPFCSESARNVAGVNYQPRD
jgi:hypothetical protein